MSDTEDIVARLRAWAIGADEQGVQEVSDGLKFAADEIERLREQRDHARRLVCWHTKKIFHTLQRTAELRGWDCYEREQRTRTTTAEG